MDDNLNFKLGVVFGYAFCQAQRIVDLNTDYRFLDDETKLELTKDIANEIISGVIKQEEY